MKSWHTKWKGKVASDDIGSDLLFSSRNEIGISEISTDEKLSPEIDEWLENLKRLSGVPFGYLVPDSDLLPEESIRFFYIDNNWIDDLIDGACSIGRHHEEYSDDKSAIPYLRAGSYRTGFLLRSMLVEGWPGLEVMGYNKSGGIISKDRVVRLSPSILLCIFGDEIYKVIIRKPAEALHFSFENASEINIKFRNSNRVIDIYQLVNDISKGYDTSSADFAYKMVDKGEEIVFEIRGPED